MMKRSAYLLSYCLLLLFTGCSSKDQQQAQQPNIVIIYADDMGYGDLNCQNPDSKIPTPHLDQLAAKGMRFTDAHSSSGICSPSRFALLTGSYHWRRQHGIVGAFGPPFFKDTDITLPQVLKTKNYRTACIGKWHLGWDWKFKNEPSGEVMQWGKMRKFYHPIDVDWSQPIGGGPLARGFDYYFGDGTINFPPYAWVENDRILETPTEVMDINNIGFETKEGQWEFRPGPKVANWNPYEVLPTLSRKSVEWIKQQNTDQPFFLYFPRPSPHAPIIPNDEFDGKSQAGAYGDFIVQSDWVVGQVLKALKEKGLEENTLVIFSADNGPEAYAWDRALKYGHFSMGDFRGLKRDVWEGGHHVPFIVKWPGQVKAGTVSNEVISQVDIMATLAKAAGIELPENAAPDSYNFLPVLKGEDYSSPLREATIHNTYASTWGIRQGDWLFINNSTGGHRKLPEPFKKLTGYTDFETPAILFNMKEDAEQRNNLIDKHPEKTAALQNLLWKYQGSQATILRKQKEQARLVSVQKIWDKGPHNAFTDLIRFQDRWFCVFREGEKHASPNGALRIINSADGENWESAALITANDMDLRDAKLSITPNNQMMLLGTGALHDKSVHTHQSFSWFSNDGFKWTQSQAVADPDFWLWRVSWHKDKAYGFGYGCRPDNHSIRFYSGDTGKQFDTFVKDVFENGEYVNETSIVFAGDTAYCLLRRDPTDKNSATGLFGRALPPYSQWTWKDMDTRIGGPHMIQLPDGRIVAAVRLYDYQVRTALCWVNKETGLLTEFMKLPSGGDTSYPGLALHEGLLWVSYYSSHKGKTSIYLAKVRVEDQIRSARYLIKPGS